MTATYERGELVNLELRRVPVVSADGTHLVCSLPAGERLVLPLDHHGLTVTRVAPREWPPQAGDVWRGTAGERWFARATDEDEVILLSDRVHGGNVWPGEMLDSYGPAALVWREGWSPKPEPAGPPSAEWLVPEDPREAAIVGLRELVDWLETTPLAPLPYFPGIRVYVDNMLHGNGGSKLDKDAGVALLRNLAATTGTTLNEYVHLTFGREFTGGVSYEAMLCNWAEPTEDLPGEGGGEVAVSGGETTGAATAPAESSPAGPAVPAEDPPADAASGVSRPLDRSGVAADSAPVSAGDGAAVTPDVWVPRRRSGTHYHQHDGLTRYTICGRTARPNGALLPRAEAEAFGAVPCPSCFSGAA